MNVGTILWNHAAFRPDDTALICDGHRLTFKTFNARVNRLANALLNNGVTVGDRIACVTPNCLEMLDIYWATAKIGAVAVPLSPLLTGRGLKHLIEHSGAVFVFLSREMAAELDPSGSYSPLLPLSKRIVVGPGHDSHESFDSFVSRHSPDEPPLAATDDHSPLMIVYSSGTTGDPKGIVLSHHVRMMYCLLHASTWRMTPESISLHTGSLVFNGAFMTLMPSFFLGGTYILHREFDPEQVMQTIERERVTHTVMVPSQIVALLDSPTFDRKRLASLEALISLGATLHLAHKKRIIQELGERFYELYGFAEGFMTILDKSRARTKLDSVGCPPPFFEMRIVDQYGKNVQAGEVGEIVGRGPILMEGYYNRPDLTEKAIVDGWLHSGDAGFVDDDGFLHLADRIKDMIKSGGVSVYPSDIEEAILHHSAVHEAAVFGVPDEKWGETPVAAVTLKAGVKPKPSASELKTWINKNVSAKFQRVSDVIIWESFPKNAAGKILKREIRAAYMSKR